MRLTWIAAALAAIWLTGQATAQEVPASRAEIGLSFAPVVATAAPAVVNIYARRVVAERVSPFMNDPFFSQFFGLERAEPRLQNSLGSGVIVDPAGYVVSNFHVVGGASEITIVLTDGRQFPARIALADEAADIAILVVDGDADLPALEFAAADGALVGDLVLAIGNPFGVGQTVTSGIISGLARSGGQGDQAQRYFIQTDAPINPGNSGGALVDMAGRLLGINTSILTRSGGSNGIGFAIPSDLVAAYLAQARDGRTSFQHPWTGAALQQVEAGLASALGQSVPRGLLVTELHPSSPLAQAGIEPGDTLVAIDGKPTDSLAEWRYRLAVAGIGSQVIVEFERAGILAWVEVALGPPPDDPPSRPITVEGGPFAGMVLSAVNPLVIDALDLPLSSTGIAVIAAPHTTGLTHLRPGDLIVAVNGRAVEGAEDAADMLARRELSWVIDLVRQGRRIRLRLG